MTEGLIYWPLFVKGVEIMLRKNWLSILAEREVPRSVEIADGLMNLWLLWIGVCAVYDVSLLLPPPHPTTLNPTQFHTYRHVTPNTGPGNMATITIPHRVMLTTCTSTTVIKNAMRMLTHL